MTDNQERISIKVAIIADISVGKTTLLNSILCNQMSSTKIRRTTMLPQVYLETKEDYDISNIFERNNNSNEKILNGTVKLTTQNCKDICHKVPKLYDIVELADNVFLDIYDIPGLNDCKSSDIYYHWISNNFYCILFYLARWHC